MKNLIVLSLVAGGLMGCSNQWRETDPQITVAEVQSLLGEVASSSAVGGGGSGLQQAMALKDDPATSIYFAEAENSGSGISPMGSVRSIVALFNFSFIGLADLTRDQILGARVFFLDQKGADGTHNCGLILGIKKTGESTFSYYGLSGAGSLGDGEFAVTLTGDSGESIMVNSYDVDGGDLLEVIQLKVWDSAGNYNGKFSTLYGFSQQ